MPLTARSFSVFYGWSGTKPQPLPDILGHIITQRLLKTQRFNKPTGT